MKGGRSPLLVVLLAAGCGGNAPTGNSPADAAQVTSWLRQRAVPFDGDDPRLPSTDLQAFKTMVGSADIVALGEATHGTAEFYRTKHRVLRLLVEEMGFTALGIEASFPDCELINEYVLHGRGDARRALDGVGFRTWRSQEALDLVEWMREYNRARGPVLSFRGFDMQHPLSAMDAVVAYLDDVDPAAAAQAEELYAPYRPYADWSTALQYSVAASSETRALCGRNVAAVLHLLEQGKPQYEAASSEAYANAAREARTVVQAEAYYAGTAANRDEFMAENALWLREQAGPAARVVVWAHNQHVSRNTEVIDSMGSRLSRALGAQMMVAGFAFGQGRLAGAADPLTHTVPPPPAGSYEEAFSRAGRARFLLDIRGLDPRAPGPDWFTVAHPHRNIGIRYDDAHPEDYFRTVHMHTAYDVVIYIENTTESRLY